MRAMNIPARVVTGYQGGEVNNVDGFWTLRNSDAHAWAEVWMAGRGWVRVDPTAAVAPGRIGSFSRLVATPGVFEAAMNAVSPGLVARLRSGWEAVNNRWNQWVLNYTQSRQLDLLKNIGFESPSWEDLAYVLIALVVGVSGAGALWTLWEKNRHDPWLRLLWRAQRALRRAGLETTATQPPRQLAALALARFGARAQPAADWLLRLEAQRYAPVSSPVTHTTLQTLRRDFRRISWPRTA
jgi:hypothetical protein